MKKHSLTTAVIFGAILLITGFAFAHSRGYHMMDGYEGGYHMMDGYGGNHHMYGWNNLSAEDQKKMQEEMDNFYAATKDLRAEYTQKQMDLEQEYAKPDRDQAAIDRLEKKLFDISSKLDRKRFEHMTTMRHEFGGMMGEGYGHGYGRGYGHGCY